MNRKWSELTAFEKTVNIISWIALAVWVVFSFIERASQIQYAELITCSAIGIVCVCEAISFWKVKRGLSYVAIAGAVCMVVFLVLFLVW